VRYLHAALITIGYKSISRAASPVDYAPVLAAGYLPLGCWCCSAATP
jgi:hypothetical protein